MHHLDTDCFFGSFIKVKIAQGQNGPALTLNVISEPDRNRVNKACTNVDMNPFTPYSIQETFNMLGRSSVFSSIDLTSVFHSIPIYTKYQNEMAFTVNGATFYFENPIWTLVCPIVSW